MWTAANGPRAASVQCRLEQSHLASCSDSVVQWPRCPILQTAGLAERRTASCHGADWWFVARGMRAGAKDEATHVDRGKILCCEVGGPLRLCGGPKLDLYNLHWC